VSANHCARIIRAAYLREAKENTSLPRDRHPCTSIEWNSEEPREVGISNWKEWRTAWGRINNPTRKAYHLFALLTGCRPGEAARVEWKGLSAKTRTLTIKKSKSGLDMTIPLSLPILRVLRMARTAQKDAPSNYVFPARRGERRRALRL
jgi:integrase